MASSFRSSEPADAVHRHVDGLIEFAIMLEQEVPDRRDIAWVAEPGMAEAGLPGALPFPQAHGEDGSVAVVMSRDFAKTILARFGPGMLDWLPQDRGGSHQLLPVIHSTREGFRTWTIDYEPAKRFPPEYRAGAPHILLGRQLIGGAGAS